MTGPTAPTADLFNPNPNDPYAGPVVRTGAFTEATAKSGAVYAFDTLALGEQVELTGGLRWDSFDVDYLSVSTNTTRTPLTRLDEKMTKAFNDVCMIAHGERVPMRDAAYMVAIDRVVRAMQFRGWA